MTSLTKYTQFTDVANVNRMSMCEDVKNSPVENVN